MHSKVKNIRYTALETQQYITSPIFSDKDVSILFALRSECLKDCKANFKSQYKNQKEILCNLCNVSEIDSQQHMLECKELKKKIKNDDLVHQKSIYEDIFKDTLKQKNIATLFGQLSEIKKSKIEKNTPSTFQANCGVLKNGDYVQSCTNLSFGK